MKYSIIMPYHKKRTLHNTLLSCQHHYGSRNDYEILVMEDCKNVADRDEHRALLTILNEFSGELYIRHIETQFENCYAPSRIFNAGVRVAAGQFIVLTNPECVHMTDVLGQFDVALRKNISAYIIAGCYSTDDTKPVKRFTDFKPVRKIWLQHSKLINRGLHWCSVLSKANYDKVGGFDEEYAAGFGREDVDFIRRVRSEIVDVMARDDILVVHQNHPDFSLHKHALWARNKAYYDKKWGGK